MTTLPPQVRGRRPVNLELRTLKGGPWPLSALGRVTTLWLAAAIMLSVASAGARTEADPANGGLWILLGMLSGLLAGAGSTFWLLAGFRSVRARQQVTMAGIDLILRDATQSQAGINEHTLPSTSGPVDSAVALVRVPTGTLFHRSDCLLVAGKQHLPVDQVDPSLEPCGVCTP